jgi:hypothetical protein
MGDDDNEHKYVQNKKLIKCSDDPYQIMHLVFVDRLWGHQSRSLEEDALIRMTDIVRNGALSQGLRGIQAVIDMMNKDINMQKYQKLGCEIFGRIATPTLPTRLPPEAFTFMMDEIEEVVDRATRVYKYCEWAWDADKMLGFIQKIRDEIHT